MVISKASGIEIKAVEIDGWLYVGFCGMGLLQETDGATVVWKGAPEAATDAP